MLCEVTSEPWERDSLWESLVGRSTGLCFALRQGFTVVMSVFGVRRKAKGARGEERGGGGNRPCNWSLSSRLCTQYHYKRRKHDYYQSTSHLQRLHFRRRRYSHFLHDFLYYFLHYSRTLLPNKQRMHRRNCKSQGLNTHDCRLL